MSIHNGVRGGVSSSNSLRKMQDFRSLHHGLHGFHSCDGGGIKDLHQALRLSSSSGHGRKLVLELAQNGAMKMKVITNNSSSSSSSEPAASSSSPSSSAAAEFSSSTSASGGAAATSTASATNRSKNGGFVARVLEVPGRVWQQVLHPLSDFGFGKRSVWEGGVGLFVMAGGILLAITLVWVKGKQIRARTRKYEAVLEFALAQGITVGTPVRIRGVDVGSVVGVRPSLERIDVVVELLDSGIVIPRNALVEVNQSGLISETLIDVTPRLPLPKPTLGPLDPGCSEEGLIVCDRERIKGEQGVSLDELVGICTKIARQVDGIGVANMAGMAERLGNAVEEAKPLLAKVTLTTLVQMCLNCLLATSCCGCSVYPCFSSRH